MAKTLSQFIAEVAQPKSEDEKAFKDKHVVAKTDDANGNGDDVFKATNIKKDKTKAASYHAPEDEDVNESVLELFKSQLTELEEDVDVYVELYTEAYSKFNDVNKQRLDEMIKSGDTEKVLFFLEAVNY